MYLAELGVDSTARRQGVATRLLEELHATVRPEFGTCVLRTLAGNDPAIALYRRHGYDLVDGLIQHWNGRDRVFLTRSLRS